MNGERLCAIEARFEEIERELSSPDALSDAERWKKLVKERAETEEIVSVFRDYKRAVAEAEAAEREAERESGEMRELFFEECASCKRRADGLEQTLRELLLPKDKNDSRNCTLEIRAGAGGEEAALFGGVLLRMYEGYCLKHRFKWEVVDFNGTELGGVKEAVVNITGKGAYGLLKYESGVHRVQRVPETESQGRIHTSTATVAVLPEAEGVDVEINEKDIRIDTYRSSGAGGQHINKTDSAIRITHFPTGIVVSCQDERSQLKNKEKAMRVLKTRLYDHYRGAADRAEAQNRKSLVGSGDRSERIRTYNFPQSRITDHRIGLSLFSMESFLAGEIDEMIEALARAEREARLAGEQ